MDGYSVMKTSSVCLVKGSGSPYDLRFPVILSSRERKSARQAFCPQEIEISRSSGLPSIPTESHSNNSLTAKSYLFPVIHSHLFMADPIKFTTSNELLILSSHISISQFAFPFVDAWFFKNLVRILFLLFTKRILAIIWKKAAWSLQFVRWFFLQNSIGMNEYDLHFFQIAD